MSILKHSGWLLGFFALAGFPASSYAFRSGPLPGKTGSPASSGTDCTQCHTGGTGGSGSVAILGVPSIYAPDAEYDLIVRVSDANQLGAGFQLSAELADGTHSGGWILTDPINTQINPSDSNWINHTNTGVDNSVSSWGALGNSADYLVRWKAPSSPAGAITFWAAGNAINNNFSRTGDRIYRAQVTTDALGSCCDTNGPDVGCTDNVPSAACVGPDKAFSTDLCADVTCECVPACEGRQCGDDGCGGSCGTCVDAHACTTDVCVDGLCVYTPVNASCDDQLQCNGAETCSAISGCVSGTPVNCSDNVACTVDACVEPAGTCTHTPNNAACNDGQFCNGAETCTAGGCAPALSPCTVDQTCDESADECINNFTPIPTVSQWGLAIITLLLLISAKVRFAMQGLRRVSVRAGK